MASVTLLVDMLVAILTTKLSSMPKGLSPFSWLGDLLYLPEVLYVLFFIWLLCSGPGKISVDYWLAGKLRVTESKKQLTTKQVVAKVKASRAAATRATSCVLRGGLSSPSRPGLSLVPPASPTLQRPSFVLRSYDRRAP
jgi:hypothetical protein